jgi:hypothetical protein
MDIRGLCKEYLLTESVNYKMGYIDRQGCIGGTIVIY